MRSALLLAALVLASERSVAAAVAHVASTTGSLQSSSVVVNVPTGTAAGNVLLADIVEIGGTTAATCTGWTQLTFSSLSSSTARRMTTLYRIATASESPSYTFVATGATSVIGSISTFSGTDASAPIEVVGAPSVQGSQTGVAATAVTTLAASSGVVFLSGVGVAVAFTDTAWSTASGGAMTEIVDAAQNDLAVGAAFSTQAATGSTGAGAASLNAPGWNVGVLIALRPAVGSTNSTAAGTATATAASCTSIGVSAPYTGDANGNGSTAFARGTAVAGPFTAVAVCGAVTGASPRTCVDSTAAASTTYYYRVTVTDADGVSGTNPQVTAAVATPACVNNGTTIGTVTAAASGCTSVGVTATFTGDANGNGSTTFQWGSGAAPGAWTTACVVTGPSPRACPVTGLTASTLYSFRAQFAETAPDTVTGTNPTAGVTATTTSCGADAMAPTITLLAPSAGATLTGAETVKVQVWDAVGLAAASPVQFQVDGTAFSATGVAASTTYACGTGCRVYTIALPAQAAGAHTLTIRATDAAGNAAQRVVSFVSAAAGSGNVLRRTAGAQLCLDCHALQTHSSQYTSTKYGNWSADCATCHTAHSTRNIALVKEQIDTPNSGPKAVDFRTSDGVSANGHATPTAAGAGKNVCEVCHTQTKNSDSTPRARNGAATDWTKHYTTSCVACHTHDKGFAASESGGGVKCSGCHTDIWNGMQPGSTKVARHRLALDATADDATTWGSPLTANAATLRSCVNTCHNDHPHATSATHEYNAYADATSPASRAATTNTTATKARTDFDAAQPNGGMCASCHRNPVVAGGLVVDRATYGGSAHDYTSFSTYGTWQYTLHDGGLFLRNCTKCHADRNDTRPAATGLPFGAVHYSDYPKLLAGSTNPAGAPGTFVCYNCHGDGATGTNASGKPIATQVAKAFGHPSNSDAVHASLAESQGASWGNSLGGVARHASCLDCHETHGAKAGTHASPGNLAGPPLAGSWGAQLTANPAFWTAPSSTSFAKKTIVAGSDVEATLCFKCHSSWSWGATAPSNTYATGTAAFATTGTVTGTGTAWTASMVGSRIRNNANGTWYRIASVASATSLTVTPVPVASTGAYTIQRFVTDTAMEFNPANAGNWATTGTANQWNALETAGGFHPVVATAGGNLGAVTLANLVTTNIPWSTTTRNTMTCSDCHESDTTTDPNGPHGSTASYILRGPNTTWNNSIAPTSTGMPAGTFCANCHSATFASSRFTGSNHYSRSEHRVACMNCHAAIPHGGPRPGMLVAPAGANANVGGSIPTWDTSQPYSSPGGGSRLYIVSYPATATTAWQQSNCGCNGTSH